MHKDVGKRVMALLLSICMIAGMVDWSGFTVRAASLISIEEVFTGDYRFIIVYFIIFQ